MFWWYLGICVTTSQALRGSEELTMHRCIETVVAVLFLDTRFEMPEHKVSMTLCIGFCTNAVPYGYWFYRVMTLLFFALFTEALHGASSNAGWHCW